MKGTLALILMWSFPSIALADPCKRQSIPWGDGMPMGHVQVGFYDGAHGVPRRICARTEVGLGGEGFVIAEPENFFGDIRVAGVVHGSYAVTPTLEVFGRLEAVRYETVISSFAAEALGLGHLSFGATHRFVTARSFALGSSLRLVLPTASGLYENAWPLSADVRVSTLVQPTPVLSMHAGLGVLFSGAFSKGPSQPRTGAVLDLGTMWRPLDVLAVVVDLDIGLGYLGPFDYVSVAIAFRFAVGAYLGVELGGNVPLPGGRQRGLLAAALRFSWRLDSMLEADSEDL